MIAYNYHFYGCSGLKLTFERLKILLGFYWPQILLKKSKRPEKLWSCNFYFYFFNDLEKDVKNHFY